MLFSAFSQFFFSAFLIKFGFCRAASALFHFIIRFFPEFLRICCFFTIKIVIFTRSLSSIWIPTPIHLPVASRSRWGRPCTAPCRTSADMVKASDCGIYPDTRNTLKVVQIAPFFTATRKRWEKRTALISWWLLLEESKGMLPGRKVTLIDGKIRRIRPSGSVPLPLHYF